jgi:hypothetical protein
MGLRESFFRKIISSKTDNQQLNKILLIANHSKTDLIHKEISIIIVKPHMQKLVGIRKPISRWRTLLYRVVTTFSFPTPNDSEYPVENMHPYLSKY